MQWTYDEYMHQPEWFVRDLLVFFQDVAGKK